MIISIKKGFTIIETLIAITILMIAIVGPLTASNRAYTASLDARNESIASFLAQEELEMVSNVKDSQSTFIGSNTIFTPNNPCTSPSVPTAPLCGASFDQTTFTALGGHSGPIIDTCHNLNSCAIKSDANLGYSYTASGTPTPFTRYFYLTPTSDPNQLLATVMVTWLSGTVTNQVALQEVLTNYER